MGHKSILCSVFKFGTRWAQHYNTFNASIYLIEQDTLWLRIYRFFNWLLSWILHRFFFRFIHRILDGFFNWSFNWILYCIVLILQFIYKLYWNNFIYCRDIYHHRRRYWARCSFYVKVVGYSIFLHSRCVGHQTALCSIHKVSVTFKWRILVQNAVMAAYFYSILVTFKCDSFLNKI